MRRTVTSKTSPGATTARVSILLSLAFAGCHSPKPAPFGPNQIDNSWIIATESCWPDLVHDGYNVNRISQDLTDPGNFRSAFPTYSAQSNASVEALLMRSVGAAPRPDITKLTHSSTPVLNRGQASVGTTARGAVVPSTNGIAPPGAFCAVQPGTPAGFR